MKKFRYCLMLAVVLALCAGVFAACDGEKVTVSLDANGGTCSVQSVTAQVGKKLAPVPAAERDGYVFDGWYTSASGGERWNFDTDKVSGAMTLYAGFRAQASDFVGVTYHVGDNVDSSPVSRDVRKGNLLPRPADPVKSGYRFEGWFKDEECLNAWDFETDTVESNITLYAKWTKVHTVMVMYGQERMASVVYEDGEPLKNVLPPMSGLVYTGLYEDANFVTEAKVGTVVDKDATYYARYEKPTDASFFDYKNEYGRVSINGLKDEFDGDEVIIPEYIEGAPVESVNLNTSKRFKRVVISSKVNSIDMNLIESNIIISPSNANFRSYDGCLYTKNYGSQAPFCLIQIPEDKRVVNVMPGAYISTAGSSGKVFFLSDDASVHENDGLDYKRIVVPDEYYDNYVNVVSAVDGYLFKRSEVKDNMLAKDGILYIWLGDDTATVGTADDGITEIGNGALHGVHEVTFGENIVKINGNLFGNNVYQNERADAYKYTFLGAVPERSTSYGFFPNVYENEGDTLEIKVKIDHVTDYKDDWNMRYRQFTLVGGETSLIEDGKLIAWFGGDTAVVGTATDGITVIGEESLYGVENITIGANIQSIEGNGLMGDLYDRVCHASLTFTRDMPAYNGSIGCPVSEERGSTFVINIPEQYVQKYANSGKFWSSWKYVKIDTEDEFTVIDGTLYKYNGNDTKVHLPASVRSVFSGALPENMTELHITRPDSTEGYWGTMDIYISNLLLTSDKLDVYIPNGYFRVSDGGDTRDVFVRFRVEEVSFRSWVSDDFGNLIYKDKTGTVTYHVDTTDSTALKYYVDMCAEMSKDSVYTKYEAEAWEVNANA